LRWHIHWRKKEISPKHVSVLRFLTVDGLRSDYHAKTGRKSAVESRFCQTFLAHPCGHGCFTPGGWMAGSVSKRNLSADKIRKYLARFLPLSACGWLPREHVAFLFAEDDEELHNLIRKQMVMPFITGEFFLGHLKEVDGGKYFAL